MESAHGLWSWMDLVSYSDAVIGSPNTMPGTLQTVKCQYLLFLLPGPLPSINLLIQSCCCCCLVASVVSDSVRPYGLQPARLLCLQDSPGKITGVVCYNLLQGIFLTQGLTQVFHIVGRFFTTEPPWKPNIQLNFFKCWVQQNHLEVLLKQLLSLIPRVSDSCVFMGLNFVFLASSQMMLKLFICGPQFDIHVLAAGGQHFQFFGPFVVFG